MITFRVYGVPAAQGSMRAILHKHTQRPILIHNKTQGLAAWRSLISTAAGDARRREDGMLIGPVALTITFHLPKPASMPAQLRTEKQREKWTYPKSRPDLSKLVRAAEDALIGVLIQDDSQIVSMWARKVYSDTPGAEISLGTLVGSQEEDDDGDSRRGTQTAGVAARAGAGERARGQRS